MTTPAQKLALRASEIRVRLAELGGTEEQTDETRAEIGTLRTEYADVETRAQAMIVADDAPATVEVRAEDREMSALVSGASIASIFAATMEHRATEGQTAELQQHLRLSANQVPLALLWEDRAVTPAPSNVGQNQSEIVPAVFPASCAAFLGIDMPTVATGEADLSGPEHQRHGAHPGRERGGCRDHGRLHGGRALAVPVAGERSSIRGRTARASRGWTRRCG